MAGVLRWPRDARQNLLSAPRHAGRRWLRPLSSILQCTAAATAHRTVLAVHACRLHRMQPGAATACSRMTWPRQAVHPWLPQLALHSVAALNYSNAMSAACSSCSFMQPGSTPLVWTCQGQGQAAAVDRAHQPAVSHLQPRSTL